MVTQESQDRAALEVRVAALEAQAGRFQAALDAISQGVAFFDRGQRLILANRRYAEIYRLSPDQLPPGVTLREIAELRAAAGTCPMAVNSDQCPTAGGSQPTRIRQRRVRGGC